LGIEKPKTLEERARGKKVFTSCDSNDDNDGYVDGGTRTGEFTGFQLTWKTPGKLPEFYVRPGIFGIISRFTLVIKL